MAGKRSCLVRLTGTRMSQKRDVNSYPDGYRVLNSSELRELLQDEEKMNQIVRLSEKVFLRFTHTFYTSYRLFLCMLVIFSLNNWCTTWSFYQTVRKVILFTYSRVICVACYMHYTPSHTSCTIQHCRPLRCRPPTKTRRLHQIIFCTDIFFSLRNVSLKILNVKVFFFLQ